MKRALRMLLLAAARRRGAAFAQSRRTSRRSSCTGTLAKVRAAGAVTIAYRESSIPFSYLSARGEPIGYSIELCKKLVEAIGEAVGRELAIKWLPVTSETRIEAIASGKADLECGSTTSNLERAEARRLLADDLRLRHEAAGEARLADQARSATSAGKTVVVTAGTTNEKAHARDRAKFKIDFRLVVRARPRRVVRAGGSRQGRRIRHRRRAAVRADRAETRRSGKFDVVGEFLSYDPYGIMYPQGRPAARAARERHVPRSRRGRRDRAPVQALVPAAPAPSSASIDLPMSPQLETIIQAMAVKPE